MLYGNAVDDAPSPVIAPIDEVLGVMLPPSDGKRLPCFGVLDGRVADTFCKVTYRMHSEDTATAIGNQGFRNKFRLPPRVRL